MPDNDFDDIPPLPASHLLPPDDLPFENPADEALFQKSLPEFQNPSAPAGGNLWLLISIGLYALSQTVWGPKGFDIHWLATLLGVIFLHEMGHYFGMVLFGYRDVRMFFIPFFGAAVTGRKHAAPAWQQLIVLLLGPLPGIVLAGILYAFARPNPDPHLREALYMLLALNGFNLLPLVPMDGGRVANILLFSRSALLEALFSLCAVAGLIALAYWMEFWLLYLLAGLVLLPILFQYRLRKLAGALRWDVPELPPELEDLTRANERDLFWRIHSTYPHLTDPKIVANSMRSLHELAVTPPPGFLASVAFLLFYVAGFAASVGILMWMVFDRAGIPPV